MEVFYSSPTRYLDAVYNSNVTWNVKTDDFFPYADNSMSYWTGKSSLPSEGCGLGVVTYLESIQADMSS